MKLLLKNAHLFDPQTKIDQVGDISIINGIIDGIGNFNESEFDKTFDLTAKTVIPGLADVHVHLREPGREDEETIFTGTRAAANGGFTAVCCMPNTEPAIDSAEVVNFVKAKSENLIVDVYPIGAVTKNREGKELAYLGEMAQIGVVGFSDDGVAVSNSAILRSAFEYISMFDLPIVEHCEDSSLTKGGVMNEGENSTKFGLPPHPSLAESVIVARDILVAEYTNGKLHLAHLSTKRSVELLRQAKARKIKVTGEVTPHHLILTDNEVKNYDTNTKMNPPLRTKEDIDELILGLKDGTLDIIASDHAPHSIEEKEWEYIYAPFGIIGLETSVGLILTKFYHEGILSLEEIIYKMSINPRKIFKLKEASIKAGIPANLSILDLNEIWNVDQAEFKSKSINTPFKNWLLKGRPVGIINNNKILLNKIEFAL